MIYSNYKDIVEKFIKSKWHWQEFQFFLESVKPPKKYKSDQRTREYGKKWYKAHREQVLEKQREIRLSNWLTPRQSLAYRNKKIYDMRMAWELLQDIGNKFWMTKERVRQIVEQLSIQQ